MARKMTETPKVEVTMTTTEVVEKPKKTRKKSATNVVKVMEKDDSHTKAITKRIADGGVINISNLSQEEVEEYRAIGSKLDVRDKMSVSNYGSELSEQLNRSTKDLMKRGTSTKLGDETKLIMKDISSKLSTIDLDEIKRPNWFVRTIREIPVLNKMFFSVQKFINKCETLEKDVENMQDKLHAAQAIALRDNTELEQRFQETISYIDVLEKLIVAAKLKSDECGQVIEAMESDPGNYSAITIHDTKNFKHELDKKIESMLTWHLSFNQSLFRIRDIQDANISHSNSISQDIDNMMPMLRDQLQQAIYLYNLEQGLKAHEVMVDGFNEILAHNADATHDLKVRVTKMTESPTLKIETLKHNQEKIKETTRDCLRIMDEAAKQRLGNEREMAKMRAELDSMMTGIPMTGAVESAAAIEAKYN
jgi:uncharacterized protein YaaN involved in tellurite resistance